jgi:hypothetical protein
LDREKVRREWAIVYLFVGRSNALVACRHQIGRTEIRNVDVQCTSASSEVKLDRQSFLHLTSGFFFGYLPCPSSDCPMNEKKEIESPPETHSAPGHSNFAAQEFGKVQRGTCVLWPSPGIPALVKIHDFWRNKAPNIETGTCLEILPVMAVMVL